MPQPKAKRTKAGHSQDPPAAEQAAAPHDGPRGELLLNLRGTALTEGDLWDALAAGCKLPRWFGRNLDAWHDTLVTGGISQYLDAHEPLVVRADAAGVFAPGNGRGRKLASVFLESGGRGRLELYSPGGGARMALQE